MFEVKMVDGTPINMVKFSYLAGENPLGTYRQVAPAAWQEVDIQNNATFYFAETQRTDISITLYDASRNVTLVFDLNRSVIVYTDSNNHFDLYRIMEATAYVQGWIANLAHFSLFNGTHLGEFRQTGEKLWVEFGKGGVPRFHFVETLRDDWSVFLHDESRNVGIQLDFWRKMVIYSDATPQQFDLYPITGGAVMSSRADLTPSLTGKTVNRIDFGTADGQILGYLRKNGLYEWVELGLDQKERFYFVETKSHKGVVVLVDVARSVTLELHLRSKKIIYSDAAANRFELYKIVNAYGKVNGWTANRVDFGSFTGAPLGTYRQTGEKTWAELNSLQKPVFYFNELLRDDWSVYLYDPSRNVTIQLDMYTQKVVYGTQPAQGERSDLYGIVRASAKPSDLVITSPLPVKGQNVKAVWFADFNGKPLGAYRQISESKWVETDSQAKPTFSFDEVKRTKYAVNLYDASRNVSLELNLHTRRIHYSDPSNSFVLYTILRSSALVTGRAVSEVTFATFAGQELGKYRQTGGDEWAEFNQSGTVTAHFKETRRDDWLVTLYDASRNVTLVLDLHSQTIYYSDGQTHYAPLYLILREEIEAAVWMQSENITSRSSLTQDFAPDRTARNLNPQPAYRTSISVTRLTSFVDIWASEEVTVEVNGASYTIDPVKSARVQPNALSKLSVSLPATDVRCPTLIVRTNLMMPDEKHYIFPDIEAHKKIVNLKDGDLYKARTQLGISDQYTEEDMAHVQQSLQNIAKTVQHTYNKKPHGVHHDRALLPKNMQHPHFVLDFTEDRPRYRPLHPSEVPALTTGATLIQGTAAQGFFDDVGNFFKKAAAVVVHTVENVGHDIVQTAENIGHDIVQTVDNVGEDIVHGDIAHIGQDLLQGGENIGSDLVKGAGHVVGDVVEGAGQLLVVTLHAAEGMVQFVINHTGFVGKALGWLLEKIGAGLDKVVDWLLDKLGWEDILHTHDVLFQLFNNKVDEFATYPEMIKQRGDQFFTHITDLVSQTMDQAIKQFDVQDVTKQPQPVKGHSGAVEKIEWILGKLVQYAPQATALAYPSFTPSYHSQADGLVGLLEQQLGGGGQVMKALRQAEEDLVHVFTDPEHSPEYLISLLLELVKAVAVLSLETVKLVFDAILDLIIGLIQAFKTAVNAPWDIPFLGDLYDTLTEGRPLSFLSMICLVIAIPVTLICKAELGAPPFQANTAAAALTPQSNNLKAYGFVYGTCHLVLGPLAVILDLKTALETLGSAVGNDIADGIGASPAGEDTASIDKFNTVFTYLNLGLGFLAQFMANPIPIDDHYIMPLDHAKNDVFEAPSYFAHVIWWYQWAGWSFNALAAIGTTILSANESPQKWVNNLGNFVTVFNTAWGLAHMGLMATLDVVDREKSSALAQLDAQSLNEPMTEVVAAAINQEFTALNDSQKTNILTTVFADVDRSTWTAADTEANIKKVLFDLFVFNELEKLAITQYSHVPYWNYSENTLVTIQNQQNLQLVDKGTTVITWVANARNYLQWSRIVADGGIPSKGFGNVMDTFPEIGQLGAMPEIAEASDGFSLIGTAFFDLLGHWGEGITYMVRTARNELL